MMDFKAVVFDMDGLLLDSERVALDTFVEACREFSFEPDVNVFYRCIGVNRARTLEILAEGYGEDFPIWAVTELWEKKWKQAKEESPIPLKPGALSLLSYLESKGMKKAVVTSTGAEIAKHELSRSNIMQFFRFIIGGDQVKTGKPSPEIYLEACRRLKEKSSDCLALEDSNNGVIAAYNAGLTVIQVVDIVQPSAEVRALGHKIVDSLVEVEETLKQSP